MQIRFDINPSRPISDLSSAERSTADGFHTLYYESMVWDGPTTWMGWPVAKNPLDLWLYQELLYEVKPEVIVETGTYFGASALYLASLCDMIGKGEVYTIDTETMPRPLHPRIHYLLGSSTDPAIMAEIRAAAASRTTLVILDSDHREQHVLDEMDAYAALITPDSYLIVEDTNINGHPVAGNFGPGPREAVDRFVSSHPEFERDHSREKFFMTFNTYLKRGTSRPMSSVIGTTGDGPVAQDLPFAAQLLRSGDHEGAQRVCRVLLQKEPRNADALHLLGIAELQLGQADHAVQSLAQAILINPDNPSALNNLAAAFQAVGQHGQAVGALRRAVALRPEFAEAHYNLGIGLEQLSESEAAIEAFRSTLALQPDQVNAHEHLARLLRDRGLYGEALTAFEAIAQIQPQSVTGLVNCGVARTDVGNLDGALESYERALAIQPDLSEAHVGMAEVLLRMGQYERGFKEYEWRWSRPGFIRAQRRLPAQPWWNGEPLDGRTILLHAEQGYGDAIQFARYVPMVQSGSVLLETQAETVRLFEGLHGVEHVFARGETLPHFDVHAPLLSLPNLLHTTEQTIPSINPYLWADQNIVRNWAPRLPKSRGELLVGLVWSGNVRQRPERMLPLDAVQVLTDLAPDAVRFIGLQTGDAAAEFTHRAWNSSLKRIQNLGPVFSDFADTAAVIAQLDLVISIDTAVAHLTGALGKPVWVPLSYICDWRWMRDRTGSPWYPTARLFRQSTPGDWNGVIQDINASLTERLSASESQGAPTDRDGARPSAQGNSHGNHALGPVRSLAGS